jgi:hypothetical protein
MTPPEIVEIKKQIIHPDGSVEVIEVIKVEVPTLEELQAEADRKLLEAFDEVERLRNLEE